MAKHLIIKGETKAELYATPVLDIDSEHLNTFDSIDKEWLEKVAEIVPNPFSTY